ncbi:hypothetical protein HAHE_21720 [Haloferula helveola]|uniref:Chromosome partition protein Smc n=1 Tax=Haloferula helveola TaxID=490095 RepID=A0ABM7RA88_9BACT|nr:hypothetical protein HAHE_21720 [Haloferula helveola]
MNTKHTPRIALLLGILSASLVPAAFADKKPAPESTQKMLSESFSTLADTLKQAEQQVQTAIRERDLAIETVKHSKKVIGEKDQLIEQLKKQLAESQKSATEWEKKSVAHAKAEAEWKSKAEAQAQRLAIGHAAQEKLVHFHGRLEKTVKEFTALESELNHLRNELKEPRKMAELVKENEKLKVATATMDKKIHEMSNGFAESKKLNVATTTELAKTKKELGELREQHAQFKSEMEALVQRTAEKGQAALKKALMTANEATQEMMAAKDRADATAKKLESLQSQTGKMESRQQQLSKELNERDKTIKSLRNKLEQAEASNPKKKKKGADA